MPLTLQNSAVEFPKLYNEIPTTLQYNLQNYTINYTKRWYISWSGFAKLYHGAYTIGYSLLYVLANVYHNYTHLGIGCGILLQNCTANYTHVDIIRNILLQKYTANYTHAGMVHGIVLQN